MVMVRYKSGLAAVFSSEDEAVAQARHDNGQPGNWDPAYIVEGENADHATWGLPTDYGHKPPTAYIAEPEEVAALECPCPHCEFQRRAPELAGGAERLALLEELGLAPKPPIVGGAVPGAGYTVTNTAVALTSATAKTMVGVLTGANTPVDMVEFGAMCDGGTGNLLVELVFGTNASNAPGTGSTSFTPLQVRGPVQTLNCTAGITWTAEPTVLTVVKRWRFALPGGPLVVQFPLGREPNSIPTASTSGKFFGLRYTSSGAVTNADCYAEVEE